MPTLTPGVAEWASDGAIVGPLVRQAIQDQSVPLNFWLYVERSGDRKPDGWFHSSSSPRMDEDELLHMLMFPGQRVPRGMGWTGHMGTLAGTTWHAIIGTALDQLGITVPLPPGLCIACGLPRPQHGRAPRKGQCGEHGAVHAETRSRGHLDKILQLPELHGFDLKTRFRGGLKKAPDMDTAYFQTTWPHYYWQVQDYMRMTGLRKFIVLFLEMGNPWELREYHVEYDVPVALEIESKYRRVLARARAQGLDV